MSDFRGFGNKALKNTALLIGAAALVSLASARWDITFGILFGGIFSCIKLFFSIRSLEQMADLSGSAGARFKLFKSFNRYGLIALCVAAAFLVKGLNPWATIMALFASNVVLIYTAAKTGGCSRTEN